MSYVFQYAMSLILKTWLQGIISLKHIWKISSCCAFYSILYSFSFTINKNFIASIMTMPRNVQQKCFNLLCEKFQKNFCCNISYDMLQNSFRIVTWNVKSWNNFETFSKAFCNNRCCIGCMHPIPKWNSRFLYNTRHVCVYMPLSNSEDIWLGYIETFV